MKPPLKVERDEYYTGGFPQYRIADATGLIIADRVHCEFYACLIVGVMNKHLKELMPWEFEDAKA